MLDLTQIPNSIVNSNSTSFGDENKPYPYLTFITFFNYKQSTKIIKDYNDYVEKWSVVKNSNVTAKEYTTTLNDRYFDLLNSINLSYTNEEEKRFLTNLDLNNESDRDILIPFYVNKINEITNYFIDKREDLKFAIQRNKSSNSKLGLAAQLKQFIVGELTHNSQYTNISDYTLNALVEDLEIDLLEKYDTFSHNYDVDPETNVDQYDVKNELYEKYFTNNILDYDKIVYVDQNSYLISAIKQYALFVLDVGFGISFVSNSNEINALKQKDFIKQKKGSSFKELNVNTYKGLSEKYAGADMYYISAFDGKVETGKLFDAQASYANILNKKYTSIQSVAAENFVTKRTDGGFFLPNTQSISFYNAFNKRYNLNDNISGICYYPDPEICGNVYGASITQLKNYPYNWQTDINGVFYEKAYKQIAGTLNSNKYQDFFGYKTEIKDCTLTHGFESLSNKGIITNYKVDIFGNEYAIFKQKAIVVPDSLTDTLTGELDDIVNHNTITSADTDVITIYYKFDGGNFAQAINNPESISSDNKQWPDLDGDYYYDILLEAGISKSGTRPYIFPTSSSNPATFIYTYEPSVLYDANYTDVESYSDYYYTNIPFIQNITNKSNISGKITGNETASTVYGRRKQIGESYIKYANTTECLPISTVFTFINNIDTIKIQNIDIIHDTLIITHEDGLIFSKILLNSAGKIIKPSTQIKYFPQNLKDNILSRYFYVEKNNSLIFIDFKLDYGKDYGNALVPTVYVISLDKLDVSKLYECRYIDKQGNYRGIGALDYNKFKLNDLFTNDIITYIDTPILIYNSLNNLFNVSYTINKNNTFYIVNMSFINRLSTAEIISCDVYTPTGEI